MSSQSLHSRQPSVNSRDFVVSTDQGIQNGGDDDYDQVSTDSYQDSIADHEELENTFDSVKYFADSLSGALSSAEFNRSMVLQAQTSGNLKSKEMELLQLQNEAQERLQEYKVRFKQGMKLLQQVSKDLKWANSKTQQLEAHISLRHPIEYSQAKEKVLSRSADLQEILRKEDARREGDEFEEDDIHV
jgi:hypothetical protein